jgi:hypothetical protein
VSFFTPFLTPLFASAMLATIFTAISSSVAARLASFFATLLASFGARWRCCIGALRKGDAAEAEHEYERQQDADLFNHCDNSPLQRLMVETEAGV